MSTLMQDLRYGFRRLRQSPGFALVCVITLALGIGANTAIFTLVDAVMLKSLPVANPKELYRLGNNGNCCGFGGLQDEWAIYSYPLYQQFRDHQPEFSQMAAFEGGVQNLNVRRGSASGVPLSLSSVSLFPATTSPPLVWAPSPGESSRPRMTKPVPLPWPS